MSEYIEVYCDDCGKHLGYVGDDEIIEYIQCVNCYEQWLIPSERSNNEKN